MKDSFLLSLHELTALIAATETWLTQTTESTANTSLSPLQLISRDVVLPALVTRLQHTIYTFAPTAARAEQRIAITLTLPEMLALFYCIPNAATDCALANSMQLLYQRLTQLLPALSK